MKPGMTKPATALLFIGLSLAGCAVGGTQSQFPDFTVDTVSAAVKSGQYYDGNAHVYAYLGRMDTLLLKRSFLKRDVGSPANFFVNGENVGGIGKNQFMFIDLPPGSYNFAWEERAAAPVAAGAVTFAIAANENLFVAFDLSGGPIAFIGGTGPWAGSISGSVADRSADGVEAVQDMKLVLPDKAVVAQLRPMGR